MRHSITSRFHGTLLGATLGEIINNSSQIIPTPSAEIIILGAQSLITLGRFEPENWREKFLPLEITPLQAIVATLPLALFFHDNKIKLHQNLQLVAKTWFNEPVMQESILSVGYAIAQALTEKLSFKDLIPQIVEFINAPSTELTDKLQQVQALLEQRAGQELAVAQITQNKSSIASSVALAFYYFLSTVEDLPLSVKRSKRFPTSSAIVGALSGAYNSASSIPSNWQILTGVKTTTDLEMLKLSDSLVAVWSGVYDSEAKLRAMTVAAPRVIRSR